MTTQDYFTIRCQEDFQLPSQCVVAPQNIGSTAIERLFNIGYLIVLNFQNVVHLLGRLSC